MKKTIVIEAYVEIEVNLDKVIKNLKELQQKYDSKFSNLRLSYEYFGFNDSTSPYLILKGDRDETKEEETTRLADEMRVQESRREYYEQLKKEFNSGQNIL